MGTQYKQNPIGRPPEEWEVLTQGNVLERIGKTGRGTEYVLVRQRANNGLMRFVEKMCRKQISMGEVLDEWEVIKCVS